MHTEFFEKTAILEEILSYKLATHSLTPKRLSNPKISDVFHATAGLLPLLKINKLKFKPNKSMTRKQPNSLFIYKIEKLKENSRKVRLDNQTINWQVLLPSL